MSFSQSLEKSWYQGGRSWTVALLPLSWIFRCLAFFRRVYLQRCLSTPKLGVPVIVVGNISVGGTGKTPLLIYLVQWLEQQGYRPGVISRGYGGKASRYPHLISAADSALDVGDEPLLLSNYCTVFVDPDRYQAATELLKKTDCNLILSDDGLQHYRLPRDIEIVLVDAQRAFGNGLCLPAGPLREPVSRLMDVDFIVANGPSNNNALKASYGLSIKPIQLRHLVSGHSIDVTPGLLHLVEQGTWNAGNKVHAVAGIGNPQRFVTSLEQLGFEVKLHALPDHHNYSGDELMFDDDLPVIITAKDAVKCSQLTNDKVWVLDVCAQPDKAFLAALENKIKHGISH